MKFNELPEQVIKKGRHFYHRRFNRYGRWQYAYMFTIRNYRGGWMPC